MNDSAELPKYKSHKEVWALQIKDIVRDVGSEDRETDGSAIITPKEEGYAPFEVDHEYMRKHEPHVGGYYVVYKDGYKSFSPAKAFEEGYTRIDSGHTDPIRNKRREMLISFLKWKHHTILEEGLSFSELADRYLDDLFFSQQDNAL